MALLDSIGSGTGNVSNLIDKAKTLNKGNVHKYPKKSASRPYLQDQTEVKPEFWNKAGSYSFKVIEASTNKDHSAFGEFPLQINPTELSQDDIFAVSVTPTQRGVIEEHLGSIIKDVSISGTTGKHPKQGSKKVNDKGEPMGFGLVSTASGLLNKYSGGMLGQPNVKPETGYSQFHHLRNYIRAYVELKKDPTYVDLQLVFMNWKDNEFLKVAPLKFTMRRSADRPFLYHYEIAMKATGRYEPEKQEQTQISKILEDINKIMDLFGDIAEEFSQAVQLIKSINQSIVDLIAKITKIVAAINTFIGAQDTFKEFVRRKDDFFWNFASNEAKLIAQRWDVMMDNFHGTKTSSEKALETEREDGYVEIKVDTATATQMQISSYMREFEGIDQDSGEYARFRALQELTVANLSSVQESIRESIDQYAAATGALTGTQLTNEQYNALNAFKKTYLALDAVILNSKFFIQNIQEEINRGQSYFSDPSPIIAPTTTFRKKILGGDNLVSLSARELGSGERYKELILLNKLVYPYIGKIDDPPTAGILKPGQEILIPAFTQPSVEVPFAWRKFTATKDLSFFERSLFVDVQLTDTNDFAVNNASDMEVTTSIDNALQALKIKLNLEPGSLKLHTNIGVDLQLGRKNVHAWEMTRLSFEQSVRMDPRFEDIQLSLVEYTGNMTHLQCLAYLAGDNEGVPVYLLKQIKG